MTRHNGGGIILPPGAGKTAIILIYLKKWFKRNPGYKCLLIAPLSVIYNAWEMEPLEWTPGMRVLNIHKEGFIDGYDLYLINPDRFVSDIIKNLEYLRLFKGFGVDESTIFKNALTANRTQLMHRWVDVVNPELRFYSTGTPLSKNLLDIYGQHYIVDKKSLGRNFYIFRSAFFEPTPDGYSWFTKTPELEADLIERISRKSFVLSEAEKRKIGYPKIIVSDIFFTLSKKNQKKYNTFHKEFILELGDMLIDRTRHKGKLYSGAVSYGYCTQFTSGNIYRHEYKKIKGKNGAKDTLKVVKTHTEFIHRERLDILSQLITILKQAPLFVVYHYQSDVTMFKKLKIKGCAYITKEVDAKGLQDIIKRWNDGRITVLYAQIKRVSHGLNLQFGGSDICFYNVPDDYEDYVQTYRRIARPGQKSKYVRIHRLICRNTIDTINRLKNLEGKRITADNFMRKMQELGR